MDRCSETGARLLDEQRTQHTEQPESLLKGRVDQVILQYCQGKLFDSCTSKVDSEPPHGSNVDIPHIHECKQTLDSMVAEKADISETLVKVDSQMMIQKYGVRSILRCNAADNPDKTSTHTTTPTLSTTAVADTPPLKNIHSTNQTPNQKYQWSLHEAEFMGLYLRAATSSMDENSAHNYVHFDKIPMYCDSKAAIAISCNPVCDFPYQATSRSEYHFIKEQVGKRCITRFSNVIGSVRLSAAYSKSEEVSIIGRMPTKIELTLEQSQQGVSNDVLIEPTSIAKALSDSSWVEVMQEELLQFKLQQVWKLMDLPNEKRAIGTKLVFKNKKDERGIVIRNKVRLVAGS
ncbi:hypothetical protein Tco_0217661 [Tanacetum coccineum]